MLSTSLIFMVRPLLLLLTSLFLGFLGWSIPVYWQLVNSQLLQVVGQRSPGLEERADNLIQLDQLGAASMVIEAAESLGSEESEGLKARIAREVEQFPEYGISGGPDPYFDQILRLDAQLRSSARSDLISNLIPLQTRRTMATFLESSRSSAVQAILRTLEMTGTRQFMPVYSAAGQPLEATILLTALLMQGNHFSPQVAASIRTLADQMEQLEAVGQLERIYFAVFSLGKRFNWNQLARLLPLIEDVGLLETVAAYSRNFEEQFSWIYAAIIQQQSTRPLAGYLRLYPEEGLADLGLTLSYGEAATRYLIENMEAVHRPIRRLRMASVIPWWLDNKGILLSAATYPGVFLILKGILTASAALFFTLFCSAVFPHLLRSLRRPENPPLIATAARSLTLTLILTLVTILMTEPGVFRQSQQPLSEVRLEWAFQDTVESLFTPTERNELMDQITIITISIFFLIQVAVYLVGLRKLAEIGKIEADADLKLELLNNEEQLFDCGLYLGLAGTVLSLIFLAVGVVQASLMAAYSSTLFGIIFVAMLKIFHVRPFRKNLILGQEN